MIQKTIQIFTKKEEELFHLLTGIGMKKNVAKLLVFLADKPEATSREIEHGTDLRQPEVSIAVKYMKEQGWIRNSNSSASGKGRPEKVFTLAKPMVKIVESIEKMRKGEIESQLALIRKIRDFV